MDIFYCATAEAHTLEDSEVRALAKFFLREADRRFMDYQEIVEEMEQEMEMEWEQEMEEFNENIANAYESVEATGW